MAAARGSRDCCSHPGQALVAARTTTPEQQAALLDRSTDPLEKSIAQIGREEGLSADTARAVMARLRVKHPMFARAVGEVRKSELKDKFLWQADRILEAITDEDIAQARLKDKMLTAAIAVDKSLLLDGQPTEIISVKELANLDDLSLRLVKELDRRGLVAVPDEASQTVIVMPDSEAGNRRDPTEAWPDQDGEPR